MSIWVKSISAEPRTLLMGVRVASITAPSEDCLASVLNRPPDHTEQVGSGVTIPSYLFKPTRMVDTPLSDHEYTSLVDLLTDYEDLFDVVRLPPVPDIFGLSLR